MSPLPDHLHWATGATGLSSNYSKLLGHCPCMEADRHDATILSTYCMTPVTEHCNWIPNQPSKTVGSFPHFTGVQKEAQRGKTPLKSLILLVRQLRSPRLDSPSVLLPLAWPSLQMRDTGGPMGLVCFGEGGWWYTATVPFFFNIRNTSLTPHGEPALQW